MNEDQGVVTITSLPIPYHSIIGSNIQILIVFITHTSNILQTAFILYNCILFKSYNNLCDKTACILSHRLTWIYLSGLYSILAVSFNSFIARSGLSVPMESTPALMQLRISSSLFGVQTLTFIPPLWHKST